MRSQGSARVRVVRGFQLREQHPLPVGRDRRRSFVADASYQHEVFYFQPRVH